MKIYFLIAIVSISGFAPSFAQTFDEERNLCIRPGSNCGGSVTTYLDGGQFEMRLLVTDYDHDDLSMSYRVRVSNRSRCDVHVASTLLRHGDTLNAQTLDIGSLFFEAGDQETSSERDFRFSRSAIDALDFVTFSMVGNAECN